MENGKLLARTIGAKVTVEEEEQIKAAAARLKLDVSALVRRAVLREIGAWPVDTSDLLLQIFCLDREAQLELGQSYSVAKFREICGQVKAEAATW